MLIKLYQGWSAGVFRRDIWVRFKREKRKIPPSHTHTHTHTHTLTLTFFQSDLWTELHIHTYIHYTSAHTYAHTRARARTHTCTHTHAHTHTHKYSRTHVKHPHTCAHTHTYTHTHIHTHTLTYLDSVLAYLCWSWRGQGWGTQEVTSSRRSCGQTFRPFLNMDRKIIPCSTLNPQCWM